MSMARPTVMTTSSRYPSACSTLVVTVSLRQDAEVAEILIPTWTADDWQRLLAEPDKHWRSGYSAKALAHCWQAAQDFPPSVRAVFTESQFELFHGLEMLLGIVEHRVPLPGQGKASQTDLFVLARSGGELVAITVEGKVSEPFDVPVSEWLLRDNRAKKPSDGQAGEPRPARGPSAGKLKRLAYLRQILAISEADAPALRYQLLHRTVSALIEAERFNARHALMLVHSFSQTNKWFDDYQRFGELLGVNVEPDAIVRVGERAGVDLYLGWVKGEAEWLAA
jgi:Domain of unknown function (DUF6946)